MEEHTFDPDLIREIFGLVWRRTAAEREKNEHSQNVDAEAYIRNFTGVRRLMLNSIAMQEQARLRKKGLMEVSMDLLKAVGSLSSRSTRPANTHAVKLSCELLRIFVTEAIQRAAAIAEIEGSPKIEATHLERILPQLLLDF